MKVGTRLTSREGAGALERLAELYGSLRRANRRALVAATVKDIVDAGDAADSGDVAQGKLLKAIGDKLPNFVLEGANQQQFVCKIAIYLGLEPRIPASLTTHVRGPLIEALGTVLNVGAPATRDIAIEGLGAVLKRDANPADDYPEETVEPLDEGDEHINHSHVIRLRRRRTMVLAVAGHTESRQALFDELDTFGSGQYDVQADLLRTLPSLHRQWKGKGDQILTVCINLLRDSASILHIKESPSEDIQAAFARYQASVFRTIEKIVDRGVPSAEFDDVVAAAVAALPPTLAGAVLVSNRRVRATVAIIMTGATLVSRGTAPKTAAELQRRFDQLGTDSTLWSNPGLVEGCYRSLPMLLWEPAFEPWASRGLKLLVDDAQRNRSNEDLVATHRGVVAGVSFRRLLIALTERMLSDSAKGPKETDEEHQSAVERLVRDLLSDEDNTRLTAAFRSEKTLGSAPVQQREWMSEAVLDAAAFETRTLQRIDNLFQSWNDLSASHQLLLTRILAAQLRSVAHDARELMRYPVLQHAYEREMPTVTLTEAERKKILWNLLSSISSSAADAADADLQDFVEHRSGGGKQRGRQAAEAQEDDVNDLPGYVLAMISDNVTYRLASAIAREVDLSLQRARVGNRGYDFAVSLYQIMLRGPHRAIFDHLLPRIHDPNDRSLVLFFRRHVMGVHECVKLAEEERIDFAGLVEQLTKRKKELDEQDSPALKSLAKAVHQFLKLSSDKGDVWNEIASQGRVYGLTVLFSYLDNLAAKTHLLHGQATSQTPPDDRISSPEVLVELPRPREPRKEEPHRSRRQPLSTLFQAELQGLGEEVRHYIDLKVSQFEERKAALLSAATHARTIEQKIREHPGLQPPERSILVALLQHLSQLFDSTYHDYVERPLRLVETKQAGDFWSLYGRRLHKPPDPPAEPKPGDWAANAIDLGEGKLRQFQEETLFDESHSRRPAPLAKPAAPQVPSHTMQFERFFVDWMSSELEIDGLKNALGERWAPWFRDVYDMVTSLSWVVLVIGIPCVVAILLDLIARISGQETWHSFEGVAFGVYSCVLVIVAVVSVSPPAQQRLAVLSTWWRTKVRRKPPKDVPLDVYPSYQFQALLPRLFRLIVFPMALLVDFDHSYHFPMDATNIALLTLMTLAFLGTSFFVRREVLGTGAQAERRRATPRQVRQILAVALVHSFAIAVLFSITFGSNYIHKHVDPDPKGPAISESVHRSDRFLGILPREAKLDLSKLWKEPSDWQKEHLDLEFYPVLILTWTALGLFFGVFLDGFMKGERLRGGREASTS